MFRNQYDNDVTTFSPQGRLHQVEYAMEAVKQGSASIGLKSSDFAVLLALKRSNDELTAHQKKIIPIDEHIGISISGLTADARVLSRWMKNECLNERYGHDEPLPVTRLVEMLGNKMQINTQRYDKRPFGVGLLIAGYDSNGAHIFQICPSANFYSCKAMAIGARSQSARTYLEKHMACFKTIGLNELIRHGLLALRECLPNDSELNMKNVSIAIVGKDRQLGVHDNDGVKPWLDLITETERKGRGGQKESTEPQPKLKDDDDEDKDKKPEPRVAEPQADQMQVD